MARASTGESKRTLRSLLKARAEYGAGVAARKLYLMRALVGRREAEFVGRLDAHRRLRAALRALA